MIPCVLGARSVSHSPTVARVVTLVTWTRFADFADMVISATPTSSHCAVRSGAEPNGGPDAMRPSPRIAFGGSADRVRSSLTLPALARIPAVAASLALGFPKPRLIRVRPDEPRSPSVCQARLRSTILNLGSHRWCRR